ncbi:hypothetical protein SAMN04488515_2232 [Cognatiyoonia koreensis]|uniref:Uncharacterized protein n=1 Tax=Cognatiyoonia koreensis TaxID=364200 RepID=A0A1I0QVL3_9RHOB|nr:hypothetical protein [Cognatiyoonia koreensis]SEW31499.1 hypothetical protein SAMN04488515_2232 [Cognatiyoonia koreensis]
MRRSFWKPARSAKKERPWWHYFDEPSSGKIYSQPVGKPEFNVGDVVRLRARPEKRRRVVGVEWHKFRNCYCYLIEVTENGRLAPVSPYWFAPQLSLVERG